MKSSSARSTPPPSLKRLTHAEALDKVLEWCSRETPLLIGTASTRLGIGWGLKETEAVFDDLLAAAKIRRLTKMELRRMGLTDGYLLV